MPPYPTPIAVPFQVPEVIVPTVLIFAVPAHVLNLVFSTFPNPTFDAVGVVQVPAYVSHFVVLPVFNAGPFNILLLSELSANNK